MKDNESSNDDVGQFYIYKEIEETFFIIETISYTDDTRLLE